MAFSFVLVAGYRLLVFNKQPVTSSKIRYTIRLALRLTAQGQAAQYYLSTFRY